MLLELGVLCKGNFTFQKWKFVKIKSFLHNNTHCWKINLKHVKTKLFSPNFEAISALSNIHHPKFKFIFLAWAGTKINYELKIF